MKKHFTLMILFVSLFLFIAILPARADGPAPPPPNHGLNGNQASPGGTGCPIDRSYGIILVITLCLAYAGFSLYKRGQQLEEISMDN